MKTSFDAMPDPFAEDFDPNVEWTEDDQLASEIDSARRKRESLEEERAQEIFERALNEEMMSIDNLMELAENGADGLSVSEMEYGDKKVKLVHIPKGYKMKFLKTSINSNLLAQNPNLWQINGNQYGSFSDSTNVDFNPEKGAVANTICTTLVDTELTPDNVSNGASGVDYVFTHVRPDSVLMAGGDFFSMGNSGNDKSKLLERGLKMPDEIVSTGRFNEVTLRRYDEQGNPLLPDALMIRNGGMTNENPLKSAAYFDVPILDFEMDE